MTPNVQHRGQHVTFSEIAEFRNGVNFTADQRGNGVPVLNVKDFQDRSHPDYQDLEELKIEAVRPEAFVRAGDTLFVRSNGNKELIGRSMHVRTPPPRPTTHSAFTIRMRITSAEADPLYCAYYVRGDVIRHTLSAQGSGTNISNLNQDILNRLRIWLPPLDTQRRIAGILSAYDDLIEVNTRRIAILEEMARRIFENCCRETSESAALPDGWSKVPMRALAAINPDTITAKNAPEEINYIDIASVSPGRVDHVQTMAFVDAPGRARRRVSAGDVLWSTVRPNRRSYALLTDVEPETVASTGFAVLRATHIPYSWFYHAVTTQGFVAYLEGRARGSAYPAVTGADFEVAEVIVPPKKILDAFDAAVVPMLKLIDNLHRQNATLSIARNLLLPKLISGEIDLERAEVEAGRVAAE